MSEISFAKVEVEITIGTNEGIKRVDIYLIIWADSYSDREVG
jgi:hypothetical protein